MALPDLLPIIPFAAPVRGTVTLPGSKSLTNRALLLAALANGKTTLSGALFSEDTEIMGESLRRLGFEVEEDRTANTVSVEGLGGEIPAREAELYIGLAGTAARFLTALCAAAPVGRYRIDGTPQMRTRPMRGLLDALRRLGADIRCEGEEGFFPLEVRACGLSAGTVEIDASESSQMLSALLMVAPLAKRDRAEGPAPTSGTLRDAPVDSVRIRLSAPIREPFVEMTAAMMKQFGVTVAWEPGVFTVPLQEYVLSAPNDKSGDKVYLIEPDATAASYFLALPLATGGSVTIRNVQAESLQGDIAFENVLREVGLSLRKEAGNLVAEYARGQPRRGVDRDFSEFSDTFLTLAAVSPLFDGATRICGILHTRKQETDRIEAMASELRKIVGQNMVWTGEDCLEIRPSPHAALDKRIEKPILIDSHGDHRVAMSFAILGCHDLHGNGQPWLAIRDPGCCAKTFPEFFAVLDSLRPKP